MYMHLCMHTPHTHTHTYTHTHTHTNTHKDTQPHTTQTRTHTHTQSHTHSHTQAHTHADAWYTFLHTYVTRRVVCVRAMTCAHKGAQVPTHIVSCFLSLQLFCSFSFPICSKIGNTIRKKRYEHAHRRFFVCSFSLITLTIISKSYCWKA